MRISCSPLARDLARWLTLPAEEAAKEESKLASAIESVLLVAGEAVTTRTLTRLLDVDRSTIERAIDYLRADQVGRGVRLQVHDNRLQLVTAPENSDVVRRFLQLPRQPKLSRPALETLAIVAYRQPVTRGEIEQVRGVNVDRIITNLESLGWIENTGRREAPGRPIAYGTTSAFLDLFGLTSLDELPPVGGEVELPPGRLTVLGLQEEAIESA